MINAYYYYWTLFNLSPIVSLMWFFLLYYLISLFVCTIDTLWTLSKFQASTFFKWRCFSVHYDSCKHYISVRGSTYLGFRYEAKSKHKIQILKKIHNRWFVALVHIFKIREIQNTCKLIIKVLCLIISRWANISGFILSNHYWLFNIYPYIVFVHRWYVLSQNKQTK